MNTFITVVGYLLGALIIFCSAFICSAPLKYILRFAINSAVGCILLSLFNFFFGDLFVIAAINPVTAVCVGVLGVPGAIAVILLALVL